MVCSYIFCHYQKEFQSACFMTPFKVTVKYCKITLKTPFTRIKQLSSHRHHVLQSFDYHCSLFLDSLCPF